MLNEENREEVMAVYNTGFTALVAGKEASDNPHRGDDLLSRAWRNGWKDARFNSCTRGMDPTREYIEPLERGKAHYYEA